MKNIQRILSFGVAAIMAASVISCTKGGNESETSKTPLQSEKIDAFDALPDEKYDGYSFKVLIRDTDYIVADMFQEEETDDKVQSAVRNRNLKVEERFGVNIEKVAKSEGFTDLNALFSGDDEYDLILPHARYSALYTAGGYLLDWNDIESLNLDGEWWDQNARKSLSINHKLMYMTGDISYWSYGATNLLLFNKYLFDELKLEYPYKQVKDNKWTLEDFETLVRKGSKDLDGDGELKIESDRFGYMSIGFIGDVQAYHATGNVVVAKDSDDTPYISYYTKRAESVWTWFKELIAQDCCYFQNNLTSYFETDAVKGFSDGRSLFTDINTLNVAQMREMDDDFGIIPWPTYKEGEKYLTNVDAGIHLFCIPVTAEDPYRTGLILEALAILGNQNVIPEYYEVTVKTRDRRDDESYEMLDLIFSGRVYDLGYYNVELTGKVGANENIANNFKALTENNVGSMAAQWSKYGEYAQERLDEFLDILASLD